MLAGLLVACVLCAEPPEPGDKASLVEIKLYTTERKHSEALGNHFIAHYEADPIITDESVEKLSVVADDRYAELKVEPKYYLGVTLTPEGFERLRMALAEQAEQGIDKALPGGATIFLDGKRVGHISLQQLEASEGSTLLIPQFELPQKWKHWVTAFNESKGASLEGQ